MRPDPVTVVAAVAVARVPLDQAANARLTRGTDVGTYWARRFFSTDSWPGCCSPALPRAPGHWLKGHSDRDRAVGADSAAAGPAAGGRTPAVNSAVLFNFVLIFQNNNYTNFFLICV